jgi:isopentenyldiphosphate isomerase
MKEYIDEIDWDGKIVNVHSKEKITNDVVHMVSLVIPRSNEGKFILSKRSKDKNPFPDMWVCAVGGKVSSGESAVEAAKREMVEEAGIKVPLKQVATIKYNEKDYKAVFYIFTTKNPISVNQLRANPKEVQYFMEFSMNKIESMISENPKSFAPTFIPAFAAFSESIRKQQINKKISSFS